MKKILYIALVALCVAACTPPAVDESKLFLTEAQAEELIAQGYNKSMVHVDFMFGSHDMEIDGITKDGEVVPVFRKGNFVF